MKPLGPYCNGWHNGVRCQQLVHPAFSACPWCGTVYLKRLVALAWDAVAVVMMNRLAERN